MCCCFLLLTYSDWGGLGDGLPGAATLTTAGGRTIQGDLVFKCLGVTPATGLFASSLGGEQLAGNGALAVEPTLQVKGWPNVFAAGDCTDVKEEKTAALAGMSGEGPSCCMHPAGAAQVYTKAEVILPCLAMFAAMVAAASVISLDQGKELQTYPQGGHGAGAGSAAVGTALLSCAVQPAPLFCFPARIAALKLCCCSCVFSPLPSVCRPVWTRRGAHGGRHCPGHKGWNLPDGIRAPDRRWPRLHCWHDCLDLGAPGGRKSLVGLGICADEEGGT